MGTDIHLYVEKRGYEYNPKTEEETPCWEFMMHEDVAWGYRNYNVFAILADVRNGHGFAGVETSKGFNVIAKPRGFPKDMSVEMKRLSKNVEHTPSWLTVKEILDFDWTQKVVHVGVVSMREYLAFKAEGKPRSWSGGVSGPGIKHVTNEEMDALVTENFPTEEARKAELAKDNHDFGSARYYTRILWTTTYEEDCSDFLSWVRGLMKPYGWVNAEGKIWKGGHPVPAEYGTWQEGGTFRHESPDEVRFVFWFDS